LQQIGKNNKLLKDNKLTRVNFSASFGELINLIVEVERDGEREELLPLGYVSRIQIRIRMIRIPDTDPPDF
jgi:hypothetical protein